jgi:phage/plasmid-associated DNA primase
VKLPDTPREVSVAEVWLKHPARLKYSGIVMDPRGREGDDKLNLWRGWAIEPKPGDWSQLRSLIDETLCGGDAESAEYVRRWIAFMLQRPWESPETAIAFRGPEGTGKGTLGRTLMQIAGVHGLTVASSSQLAGRFNAHLRNCVFLFADEALWPGQKDAEGILKQLVTEPVISYEAKGRDIVPGRNLVHLMLASNEKWIVPAGADARRFAVFDVSDNRKGDREFFTKLNRQLEDGGLAGMLHELMALDLEGWHPALNVPRTAALADQKQRSLSAIMKWWQEILSRGQLPTIETSPDQWTTEAVTLGATDRTALLDDCDRYLKRNRVYHEKATPAALLESGRPLGLSATRIKRGRERAWIVPPLAEMRAAFERHVGAQSLFD